MATQGSNASAVSRGGTGTVSTPANNVGGSTGGRRSSGSGGLFSNLTTQKRGSGDAAAQARRESFSEMKPTTGFVGKMWNNFTAGSQNK